MKTLSPFAIMGILFAFVLPTSVVAEMDAETAQLLDKYHQTGQMDYARARWAPIHFKPAIDQASNEDCLQCHKEILDRKVRTESQAGVKATDVLAWYQTLTTYEGEQDTFHRRHLLGPLAKKVMDLKCNTCHQNYDPRENSVNTSADGPHSNVQRKQVDPNVCLMCHGQFPWEHMTGLTGPWTESGKLFGNNCMACHAAFRTNRHQVNFLKPENIETEGTANGDVCYGWVFTKVMTMAMFVTDACLWWWPIVWKRLLLAKFASE